ncbi:hypothetical protein LK540_22260 [Massilia sp. IC2-278]|uniref:hypothetical protein n=1 Tax=Massilia sp. IC2-278 TaxID=2887200 RepID=UPI001E3125E1|nr:hypothetical protein [Massilia sp. IC2-278]MCC2963162.1 hypothetical protein [Massilia sp. IC2-278]
MSLYTRKMTTLFAEKRPPVHLETIDRPSVRQFVAADSQYLLDAIAAGRNPSLIVFFVVLVSLIRISGKDHRLALHAGGRLAPTARLAMIYV